MLKHYVITLVILLFNHLSWGGELLSKKIDVNNFGVIYDVIQYDENKIFVAAEKGVFSYSGKVLRKMDFATNEVVHKLVVANREVYGLSFKENVFKIKNDSLILFGSIDVKETINSFLVSDNTIYATSPKSLIEVKQLSFQNITHFDNSYVLGLFRNQESSFLFIENKQEVRLQNVETGDYHLVDFNSKIDRVFFNDNTNYFIADQKGYYLDLANNLIREQFELPKELLDVKIFDLKDNNKGLLYLGHNNGFSIYDKKEDSWSHHLQQVTVHSVAEDSYGNIWLGTKFEGLLQIPSLNIYQQSFNSIIKGNDRVVKSYLKNDILFLGTNLGNVIVSDLKNENSELIELSNNGEVQAMYLKENFLYVYCDLLYKIDLNSNEVVESHEVHSTKAIYVDDNVFCATAGDFQDISSALKLNKGIWHTCIYSDKLSNILYVGTKSGLIVLQKRPLKIIENKENKNQERIFEIVRENGEIRCYGSEGGVYDKTSKLVSRYAVQSIKGIVHLNTNKKLIYNKENMFLVTNNKEVKVGFVSKLLNGLSIVSVEVYNNSLIIVTPQKRIVINDFMAFFDQTSFKDLELRIESNVLNDTDSSILLNYDNEGVHFVVATNKDLSFFHLFNISYKIEKKITPILPNQKGEFELNLEFVPEGKTNITFFLSNGSGQLLAEKSIKIDVKHPFWKSIWFYLILFSLLIVLLLVFQKRRVAKLNAENLEKIKQEQIKTRLVHSELTAIRSQMNPHFVFNTLSTIQLKIAKQETNLAFKMVQKFSSLMRGVLNYSQVEVITLKQELTILKNYIELEQERFDDEIIVDIIVDANIDVNDYRIPSLITQPIVENCLQHGLRHKEGKKKLEIKVSKLEDERYCVEITDNGIGIEAANKINEENNMKHSFAMSALKKRINFINSLKDIEVELEIKSSSNGTKTKILVNDYD